MRISETPDSKPKVEINVKKQQEVEYVLKGTLDIQPGHSVWELNEETGQIKKAEYENTAVIYGATKRPEKLIINPDCVYIPALNEKNVIKKYLKNKEQESYYKKDPIFKLDAY